MFRFFRNSVKLSLSTSNNGEGEKTQAEFELGLLMFFFSNTKFHDKIINARNDL